MTGTFTLRRLSALSVAITIFAAPIASAQSRDAVLPGVALSDTALLTPAAFGRLVHLPPADVVPVPVVPDPPRSSLFRQATEAMARQAPAAPAKAPQQKSWVSRHKAAVAAIIVGVVVGVSIPGLVNLAKQ